MRLWNWTSNLTSYRSAVEEALCGASCRKFDLWGVGNGVCDFFTNTVDGLVAQVIYYSAKGRKECLLT